MNYPAGQINAARFFIAMVALSAVSAIWAQDNNAPLVKTDRGDPAAEKSATTSPATPQAVSAEEIKKLIAQLGNEDVKIRDAATKKLIEIGKPARPAIEDAAKNKNQDPEIVNRAISIIKTIDLYSAIAAGRQVIKMTENSGYTMAKDARRTEFVVNGDEFVWIQKIPAYPTTNVQEKVLKKIVGKIPKDELINLIGILATAGDGPGAEDAGYVSFEFLAENGKNQKREYSMPNAAPCADLLAAVRAIVKKYGKDAAAELTPASKPAATNQATQPAANPEEIKKLIDQLSSSDGEKRVAATKEIFALGEKALELLKEAGATQITPKGPDSARRIDVVYSLLDGLKDGRYFKNNLGLAVEAGCTLDDLKNMGKKYEFTVIDKVLNNNVCHVKTSKALADVIKDILSNEPKVVTIYLSYLGSE